MAGKKTLPTFNTGNQNSVGTLDEAMAAMFAKADEARIRQAMNEGLLVQSNNGWRFGRVDIDRVGIRVPEDITEQEYAELGAFLLDVASRIQWLLGDWLAYGENREWGETYQRVAEKFGYETNSLHNMAYVCRSVHFSLRREKLTFGHHKEVASRPPDEQSYWLGEAEREGWSVAALRQNMKNRSESKILTTLKPQWEPIFTKLKDPSNLPTDYHERRLLAEQLRQLAAELEQEPPQ
jgi:hypothetical protein